MSESHDDRPELVELLCLDVDGVLTDGSLYIDDAGRETKRFHVRDGCGIAAWKRMGGEVAIITGRKGNAVMHRANELGIRHVYQGVKDKRDAFGALLDDLDLLASQAAVIGDDLPDLPLLHLAGYPISVADGAAEARAAAAFVTTRPGGQGAVREAIEHILKARGQWDAAVETYC